jgi:toxin ParE1/3/4
MPEKSLPCRFTPQAESDLESIALYIASDSPRRALTFANELREHCLKIALSPLAYALREEYGVGVRIAVHGNYLIFHSVRDDALVIESIVHGARHREGLLPRV